MATITKKIESARGCGYRKKGGIYLVSDGKGRSCFKLPIELPFLIKEGEGTTAEQLDKLRAHNSNPDWSEVVELLRKAYNAISEQREDPRKY